MSRIDHPSCARAAAVTQPAIRAPTTIASNRPICLAILRSLLLEPSRSSRIEENRFRRGIEYAPEGECAGVCIERGRGPFGRRSFLDYSVSWRLWHALMMEETSRAAPAVMALRVTLEGESCRRALQCSSSRLGEVATTESECRAAPLPVRYSQRTLG